MIVMVVASAIFLTVSHEQHKINEELLKYVSIIVISVLGVVGLVLVGVLCGFHCFLNCCKGQQTTRQLLSSNKRRKREQQEQSQLRQGAPSDDNETGAEVIEGVVAGPTDDDLIESFDDGTRNCVPQHVQDELDACTSTTDYVVTWISNHMFLLENSSGKINTGRTYLFRRPQSLLNLRQLVPVPEGWTGKK